MLTPKCSLAMVTIAGAPRGSSRSGSPCASGVQTSDRKSTRLNSSHGYISYAVFCLKKKTRTPLSTRSRSLLTLAMRLTFFPNELHRINSLHSELRSLLPLLEHANEIIIASNEIVGFPVFCTGEMQSIPRLDFDTLREPAGQCKDSGRWAYSMSTES